MRTEVRFGFRKRFWPVRIHDFEGQQGPEALPIRPFLLRDSSRYKHELSL
ncbi:MAG: hypothetical protein RL033_6190, partial [Pseudomonadota bacterium]